MKKLQISKIEIRKELFLRQNYNNDAIERYKEMFESGKSNPIIVSEMDGKYILVDGFHRVEACPNNFIEANIEKIPEDELRSRAIQENLKHGVPLNKEERDELIKKLYLKDNKGADDSQIMLTANEVKEMFESFKSAFDNEKPFRFNLKGDCKATFKRTITNNKERLQVRFMGDYINNFDPNKVKNCSKSYFEIYFNWDEIPEKIKKAILNDEVTKNEQ